MKRVTMRATLSALATCLLLVGPGCRPTAPADSAIVDVRPERVGLGDTLMVEGPPYRVHTGRSLDTHQGARFRADVDQTLVILEGQFTDAQGQIDTRRVVLPALAEPSAANPKFAERVLARITKTEEKLLGYARFSGKVGVEQRRGTAAPVTFWTGLRAPVHITFFPTNMNSLARQVVGWINGYRVTRWLGVQTGPRVITVRASSRGERVPMAKVASLPLSTTLRAVSRVTFKARLPGTEGVVHRVKVSFRFTPGPGVKAGQVRRVKVKLSAPHGAPVTLSSETPRQGAWSTAFAGEQLAGQWALALEGPAPGDLSNVTLEAEVLTSDQDGLAVAGLRGGRSLAQARGMQVGDIIVAANGRPVNGVADLTRAVRRTRRRSMVSLTYRRGEDEKTLRVPAMHKPVIIPTSLIYLGVMAFFALVVVALSFVIAGLLTWVERRVAARMQFRVGPNRVGPQGIIQWMADGIKLVLKEDIIPDDTDHTLFKLAPYLVMTGFLGTFIVIPFGQALIIADLNVGLLWLLAITGFVALGLMMAGWSANNKWSLLGGMRSAAQIVSYEIPTGLALMVPVVLVGSLSTQDLVAHQGGFPWQWTAFDNPLVFTSFFIYFISALAEGNRVPFDLPEAESELVAGYNIEYSGWRFAVFFLCEWGNLFVIGAVATTVFLGGWQVPGVDIQAQATAWYWQVVGLGLFFAKAMTLVFVIVWVRWTLPRFRVDQMMALCWKYFVPWTFAAILFNAFWVWIFPQGAIRDAVQWATFLACGVGLLTLFIFRVMRNFRQNPEKKYSWNPFY